MAKGTGMFTITNDHPGSDTPWTLTLNGSTIALAQTPQECTKHIRKLKRWARKLTDKPIPLTWHDLGNLRTPGQIHLCIKRNEVFFCYYGEYILIKKTETLSLAHQECKQFIRTLAN